MVELPVAVATQNDLEEKLLEVRAGERDSPEDKEIDYMISLLETFRYFASSLTTLEHFSSFELSINWGADGFWHQDLDSLRANHGFKGVWFEVLSAFDWLEENDT